MNSLPPNTPGFLSDGGTMGALMRTIDWSATPIGPVEGWPQSLRTSVSTCLNSRFPILLWWGPSLVMLYNDAYRPILGNKHPASMGSPGQQVWPEIWPIIGPMLESVLSEGKATWSENQLLLLDRNGYPEECYFTFSYSPIHDESGGIGGAFCAVTETTAGVVEGRRLQTLRDLGRQLKARQSVSDVLRNAQAVLANNPYDFPFSVFYRLDEAASVAHLELPTGFESLFSEGLQTVELNSSTGLARAFTDVITRKSPLLLNSDQVPFLSLPRGAWQMPPSHVYVLPITPNGFHTPYAVLIAGINPHLVLDTKYRDFFQLIADQIATEINNVRAYEEERRRAQALLELNQAKTRFFSNISHEFRTPLTLLLGPLDELLRKAPVQQHESLQMVKRNALRLLKLVNTLLDFSRAEAGRLQPHFEPVNLAILTSDLASNFRSAAGKAGLDFVVQTAPLSAPVVLDHSMWEKIVLNLLSNAFKYTLAGEIRVSLHEADQQVILTVSDTGIGIPKDQLLHIFDRFYQVNRSDGAFQGRTFEGTGIGLAFVKELVELHNGTITAESEPGRGSSFTVIIPRKPVDSLQQLPENQPDSSPLTDQFQAEVESLTDQGFEKASDPEPAKPRLVLADDNADMRAYVSRLLAPHYTVEAVADGQAALEAILRQPPQLVLSDIMMPVMDGVALLNRLKSNPQTNHIPVILLSARAGEEAAYEGYVAGVDDYLVKPFTARELLVRVQAQLRLAWVRQENQQWLQRLFEQAPVVISIVGREPDFVYRMANSAFAELIDRPLDQILGKPLLEVLPEIKGQGFDELLHQVATTGIPYIQRDAPVRLVRQGKPQSLYFDYMYHPIREADESISGVMGVVIDVTEKVVARQKIEESESRFRAIADTAPVLIWTSGTDKLCNFFNKVWLDFTGRPMEQELGNGWVTGVHPDDVEHCMHTYTTAFDARQEFQMEYRLRRFDGAYHWFIDKGRPRFAADGTFLGYIGGCTDINEQKVIHDELERRVTERTSELRNLNTELERSNLDLLQFASVASHDLKEPLRKIQSFSNLLTTTLDGKLSEDERSHFGRITGAAARMQKIVDDVLRLSKLSNTSARHEIVDLNALIDGIADDLSITIQEKKARLEIDTLPLIEAIPGQMHQLFQNLISNGLKFVADRPPVIRVTSQPAEPPATVSAVTTPGDYIRISIRDNGIGFETQYAEKIFGMFQRLHGRGQYEGTGIGLTICRRIVENHHGQITAEGKPGQGAHFMITLPLRQNAFADRRQLNERRDD
ncbi:ATP-binding protein [Larkinella sp. VNQ87]|uniref:ATP-binding protein n=1 Tax=Larkinella sp. VNQ87 TaxID=3400921 RepID=UPI003BFB106F